MARSIADKPLIIQPIFEFTTVLFSCQRATDIMRQRKLKQGGIMVFIDGGSGLECRSLKTHSIDLNNDGINDNIYEKFCIPPDGKCETINEGGRYFHYRCINVANTPVLREL